MNTAGVSPVPKLPEPPPQPPIIHHGIRPSIHITMIRHAESRNNEMYREARQLYLNGSTLDVMKWEQYIQTHRTADPGLSHVGIQQSHRLADYLVPHLLSSNTTISPTSHINIITSPMKRTCDTIRPTILGLLQHPHPSSSSSVPSSSSSPKLNIIVNGFYFESEGCHLNDIPQPGMSPAEIQTVLLSSSSSEPLTSIPGQIRPNGICGPVHSHSTNTITTPTNDNDDENHDILPLVDINFIGFHPTQLHAGWYQYGTGPETRSESEQRASKFYVWLCEYLNEQLLELLEEKEEDTTTDTNTTPPHRKKNIQLLIGHGDFMSLVLKRMVSGFGHAVETVGIPHRSAFVHWNTGMTELEYFGHGRFLIMSTNTTPHLVSQQQQQQPNGENSLLSGGTLKDGWSYLMPSVSNTTEVSMVFSEDELDDHVLEQREALKALYLSSKESETLSLSLNPTTTTTTTTDDRTVEPQNDPQMNPHHHNDETDRPLYEKESTGYQHFIVKRGLQVMGVASYSVHTGHVFDVAIRPSGGPEVSQTLFRAIQTQQNGTVG